MRERGRHRALRASLGLLDPQLQIGGPFLELPVFLLGALKARAKLVDLDACLVGLVAEIREFLGGLVDQGLGPVEVAHCN